MLHRGFVFLFVLSLAAFANASETVYTQACRVINEDDYVQLKVQTDLKNNFALTITAFEDENCETAYLVIDRYFKIQSLENEKLNLVTEKISYTSLSNEVSQALNMTAYCGLKNWKTKVEQNVTGRECDHYLQLKAGQAFYQILKAQQSSIWLGDDMAGKNGRSEDSRPNNYDLEFKQ